ncbi:MAG: TIGR02186 family protein [Alphaproteobacteria bacterium]|nr:TIGR02186 family protein [Alphaproteobacteria bacterium]
MARLALLLLALIAAGQVAPGGKARAEPLVADLSSHLIAITTGFTGAEVLVFGATDGEGDVAVIVRGPEREEIVRRKQRMGGIWIHGQSFRFRRVPAFYTVATTKPLNELATQPVLARHQIGLENLRLDAGGRESDPDYKAFADALIRLKQSELLFPQSTGKVQFLGNQLFRASIGFPANVPVGTYLVEVFLLRNGEVVGAQSAPLVISKIGLGADIFLFAHRDAPIYGAIAILMALVAGSSAAYLFRKV